MRCIGIYRVGAPELPVARVAGRSLGQLDDIPVEFDGAGAGGGPATVLEHGNLAGAVGRLTVFAIGYSNVVDLIDVLLELQAGQRLG